MKRLKLITQGFSNDPYLIAPMQSFIVEKIGQISELQFNFTMSTTTSDITLRSSRRMEEATLKMDVLRNQVAQSHIRLKYVPLEENRYNARKDMWTLFGREYRTGCFIYVTGWKGGFYPYIGRFIETH